jgi:hypothetical protein
MKRCTAAASCSVAKDMPIAACPPTRLLLVLVLQCEWEREGYLGQHGDDVDDGGGDGGGAAALPLPLVRAGLLQRAGRVPCQRLHACSGGRTVVRVPACGGMQHQSGRAVQRGHMHGEQQPRPIQPCCSLLLPRCCGPAARCRVAAASQAARATPRPQALANDGRCWQGVAYLAGGCKPTPASPSRPTVCRYHPPCTAPTGLNGGQPFQVQLQVTACPDPQHHRPSAAPHHQTPRAAAVKDGIEGRRRCCLSRPEGRPHARGEQAQRTWEACTAMCLAVWVASHVKLRRPP